MSNLGYKEPIRISAIINLTVVDTFNFFDNFVNKKDINKRNIRLVAI